MFRKETNKVYNMIQQKCMNKKYVKVWLIVVNQQNIKEQMVLHCVVGVFWQKGDGQGEGMVRKGGNGPDQNEPKYKRLLSILKEIQKKDGKYIKKDCIKHKHERI